MTSSKYFFLHVTLSILFLSFPSSYAHDQGRNHSPPSDNKCQCPCPCQAPPENSNQPSDPTPIKNQSPPQNSNDNNQSPPQKPENNNQTPPQKPENSNQTPPSTPNNGNQSHPQNSNDNNQSPPQKPENSNQTPPSTPNNGNQSPPSTPSDSNQSPPSTPSNSNQSLASTPSNSNQSPPSTPSNSKSPPSPNNNSYGGSFTKVFAFGDSFTDTGNAFILGGLKSFVGSLISHLHGGTPLLPGHRQCNGRLVVDFLCEKLELPYLPPYKKSSSDFSFGANFAVAGSTSLTVDFFTKQNFGLPLMWKGIPLNFQTQVDWFHKFLQNIACRGKSHGECKTEIEGALFWIGEMGGDDYARTFGSPLSKRWLTDLALDHVHRLLKALLDSGAKYIVVQGLPPIGCCPIEMFLAKLTDRDPMGCASTGNALIQTHNDLLQKMIANLQQKYPSCTIAYADYWNAYKTILDNRQKYQFAEPFKACCGGGGGPLNFNLNSLCGSIGTSACKDPSQYMHWDGLHFTESVHKHLSDLFLHQDFCKPSFHELVKKKMGM